MPNALLITVETFRSIRRGVTGRANLLVRAARQAVQLAFGDVLRQAAAGQLGVYGVPAMARSTAFASPQPLEDRRLMSAGVTFANGTLTVTGSATAASTLSVTLSSNAKTIVGSYDGHTLSEPASSVKAVVLVGGSGNDWFHVDNTITVPDTITTGNGTDSVQGDGGNDSITAGDGNDLIQVRGTAAHVVTGDGNDTVNGGGGAYTINLGNGTDLVNAGSGNDSVVCGSGNDTIFGQNGNDTLIGGTGNDSLNGGLGNDRIVTNGNGRDSVYPGGGDNTIQLGSPNTVITGTSGDNTYLNDAGLVVSGGGGSTAPGTGGSGTTPSPTPTGLAITPTWVTTTATDHVGGGPTAVIDMLDPTAMVGGGVVVRGLDSTLGDGSPIDANYQWNFGDAAGAHDTLDGFNAAHVYDTPGTYAVTLTVTNVDGKTSTATAKVTIAADARTQVYVNAATGNDANSGLSPAAPIKTVARAAQLVGNGTELLFARGQVFNMGATLSLKYSNVLVGAYGSGALPILNYTYMAVNTTVLTTLGSSAVGVTIQDVEITADYPTARAANQVPHRPMGINVGGYDTTVRDVTFANLEDAMDSVGPPVGLTVLDSRSTFNGIASYFLWATDGQDYTLAGNTVPNSIYQHDIRTVGATEENFSDNDLTNNSGRGCIEVHAGGYAWVDGNTVVGGDIRVGPRGATNESPTTKTIDSVIQRNNVTDTEIRVMPGSQHIMIRNNVIRQDTGDDAIDVTGQDSVGRQTLDLRVFNNTAVNTSTSGQFTQVWGYVDGMQLEDNLYVAPHMSIGSEGTAPVFVSAASLAGWTDVTNNVWATPAKSTGWAQGGINFVGAAYVQAGELTPAEWNALPQVGTDDFAAIALNATSYKLASSASLAATAGKVVPGVYGDLYGDARPTTGTWSVGAVQA